MASRRLHEAPSLAQASPAGQAARPALTWHGLHTWALVMAATAAARLLLPSPAAGELEVKWVVWEGARWTLALPYLLSLAHLATSLVLAHRVQALLYKGAVMVRPSPSTLPSGGTGCGSTWPTWWPSSASPSSSSSPSAPTSASSSTSSSASTTSSFS